MHDFKHGRSSSTLTRRAALRAASCVAAVGLANTLGLERVARAAARAESSRRFVFCYFPGGWDQLLFLDPRDPDANGKRYDDSNRSSTLTETRYATLEGHNGFAPRLVKAGNLTFGPAVEKPGLPAPKLADHF